MKGLSTVSLGSDYLWRVVSYRPPSRCFTSFLLLLPWSCEANSGSVVVVEGHCLERVEDGNVSTSLRGSGSLSVSRPDPTSGPET